MKLRLQFVLIVLGLAAVAVLLVLQTSKRGEGPWVEWRVGGELAQPYIEVEAETPVQLALELTAPAHVYVASHHPLDGTLALFPTPWLSTDLVNPLPAGEHLLPGSHEDEQLAWPVRAYLGATDYLLVVSEQPLPELEELFARLRQMSNTTFPDKRVVVTAPKGRKGDEVPPRAEIPSALLRAAAEIVAEAARGPLTPSAADPAVRLTSFKVKVAKLPEPPNDKDR